MGLLVDADGQEALKRRTMFVKYANRGVACARELTRCIQYPLEYGLKIKLGDERAPGFDQQFEAAFAFPGHRLQAVGSHRCSLRPAREGTKPELGLSAGILLEEALGKRVADERRPI